MSQRKVGTTSTRGVNKNDQYEEKKETIKRTEPQGNLNLANQVFLWLWNPLLGSGLRYAGNSRELGLVLYCMRKGKKQAHHLITPCPMIH